MFWQVCSLALGSEIAQQFLIRVTLSKENKVVTELAAVWGIKIQESHCLSQHSSEMCDLPSSSLNKNNM
jgi:hypothetical protein